MSRTKNRSAVRRGQLIIKNRDGSTTAVTPNKNWSPGAELQGKSIFAPEPRLDIIQALRDMADAQIEEIGENLEDGVK